MLSSDESYEVCRLGPHLGSTFTGTDRNGRAKLPHRTKLSGPCIAAILGEILYNQIAVCFISLDMVSS